MSPNKKIEFSICPAIEDVSSQAPLLSIPIPDVYEELRFLKSRKFCESDESIVLNERAATLIIS